MIFTTSDSDLKKRCQESFKAIIDDTVLKEMLYIIYNKFNLKIRLDETEKLETFGCNVQHRNLYSQKQIIIGISELLSPELFSELTGRIAQKLCIYAMTDVFKNNGKPYFKQGDIFQIKFENISRDCAIFFNKEIGLTRYLIFLNFAMFY